jgi:hypothetical protein
VGSSSNERSKPPTGVEHGSRNKARTVRYRSLGAASEQARACDFRALLRLSVRTRAPAVRRPREPMLS